MALKYIFNPFIVFVNKCDKLNDYNNFNGKYVICKEIERGGWIFISLDTFANTSDYHIDLLISNIIGKVPEYSSSFEYGTDYMLSTFYQDIFDEKVDEEEDEVVPESKPTSSPTVIDDISVFGATYENAYNYVFLEAPVSLASFNYYDYDVEKTMKANKINVAIYQKLNDKLNNKFTSEQLASLCATFCNEILLYTQIESPLIQQNQIYEMVLNFYSNEGTDDILDKFNLLSSLYTTTPTSTCGCTSVNQCTGTITSSTSTTSQCDCAAIYKEYLQKTLKTMLGNNEFYKDWFAIDNEGENIDEYNSDLCEDLIELLNEFMEEGYDLTFSNNSSNLCPAVSSEESECNYLKIRNYIKVLQWVSNGEIDENKNKIKSYGEQFGELLPKLMF